MVDLSTVVVFNTISGWWLRPTPLKNMSSSVGIVLIPNICEKKKGSKPPTSIITYDIPINRTNGFVTDLTSSAILNSDLPDR